MYVSLRSAHTPRPASFILERSLDGDTYDAWQYFSVSDSECQNRYQLRGHGENYQFTSDSEVICSIKFNKPIPLKNGEVQTDKNKFVYMPITFVYTMMSYIFN